MAKESPSKFTVGTFLSNYMNSLTVKIQIKALLFLLPLQRKCLNIFFFFCFNCPTVPFPAQGNPLVLNKNFKGGPCKNKLEHICKYAKPDYPMMSSNEPDEGALFHRNWKRFLESDLNNTKVEVTVCRHPSQQN